LAAAAVIPAIALAARSLAFPLALGLLPSPLFALIGSDPLPKGAVVDLVLAWTALGILLWFTRRGAASRGELLGPIISAVPVLLSFVLVGVLVARLGASPASSYGGHKLELFIARGITVLIAGIIVGRHHEDFDLFVGLTLAVAALAAAVLFVQLASGQAIAAFTGRFTLAGTDPITLGRQAGVGLLLAMYFLTSSRTLWQRMCALSALPLLAVGIVASGGRGPVVGVVLGLIVFFAFVGQDPVSRRRIPLTLVGGLAAVILVAQFVPGQAASRALSVLTGTGAGVSSNGRSDLWSQAIQAFSTHPFVGLGTGGFASVNPADLYPHNILLEVGSELGLVGLVPMIGIIVTGAATLVGNCRRSVDRGRARSSLVIALFVAALTNAMFSGDLSTNGDVWLALGLGIGLAHSWSRHHDEGRPQISPSRLDWPDARPGSRLSL
jgi:O-Antigen ligase